MLTPAVFPAVLYLLALVVWVEMFCLVAVAVVEREIAWTLLLRMLVVGLMVEVGAAAAWTFVRCLAYQRSFPVLTAFP
ncbi:protein UL148C [Human betaherpesvirus 5]|nr:protein UL148C [Human betaherpesvirus 5]